MMGDKRVIVLIDGVNQCVSFCIRFDQRMRQDVQDIFVIKHIIFSISRQGIRVHFEQFRNQNLCGIILARITHSNI